MWHFSLKIFKDLGFFEDLERTFKNLGKVNEVQWSSVFFVFPCHMMSGKLYTVLMKKFSTVTTATKSSKESATTVTHAKVLAEMVSPSQETNLTFPWFMVMHPGCGRVYFVERSSNKSQWSDPRQQGPPPIVHLPPVDVLSDLLGLVPSTVVCPDDQVHHMVPWVVSTRQKRMRQHWQGRPFRRKTRRIWGSGYLWRRDERFERGCFEVLIKIKIFEEKALNLFKKI